MITQLILNFISSVVAGMIGLIPEIPTQFYAVELQYQLAMNLAAPMAAKFGVLIPWNAATSIIGILLTLIPIWLSVLPVRVALWAFGR